MTSTVVEMKAMIAMHSNIPVDEQAILCQGVEMKDGTYLRDYAQDLARAGAHLQLIRKTSATVQSLLMYIRHIVGKCRGKIPEKAKKNIIIMSYVATGQVKQEHVNEALRLFAAEEEEEALAPVRSRDHRE